MGGITTQSPAVGLGDYLEIPNMQHQPTAIAIVTGTVNADYRICGAVFSATADAIAGATVCSFNTPFKIGVHFDEDESIAAGAATTNLNTVENAASSKTTDGAGYGYSGFYLNYWQNSC